MTKKLFLLIPLLFLLTGCWNYRELNQLAITTAMAIDLTDDGDYRVSLLIANGKNNQTNNREGQSQTVVYSGEGPTISRAIKEINLQISKIPYIGHLGVVVVSENVAKEGMRNVLDYLLRNPESVKRFYLILAKDDSAEDVIKVLSPLETFPGQSISTNIAISNEQEAISTVITYSKFVENLLAKGKEPSLPTISVSGDPDKGSSNKNLESSDVKTRTKLGTIALFNDDKLVYYTTKSESRGINIITNQIDEMIVEYECDDGYIVVNLTGMESSVSVDLKNNKPHVNISVQSEGAIQEITCNKNIQKNEVILEIEDKVKDKIKSKIKHSVEVTQEYNSDVFGIGNLFYKKYPSYYNKITDWSRVYPSVTFNYKVDIKLNTKGSVEQTIQEDL